MSVATGIFLKLASVVLFSLLSMLIRAAGQKFPLGQIIFFRSAFAILPVILIFAWRHELRAAVVTQRPWGQLTRGIQAIISMALTFAALARLPLVDATAISFAAPLITVALAALILKEPVHAFRWSAAVVGFGGVLVMLWPYLDVRSLFYVGSIDRAIGALCALGGAISYAATVIQTRRLTDTETTSSIVLYFSLICAVVGLCTAPFGWIAPSPMEFFMLIMIGTLGGLSHLLVTESYRYAPTSVVAPFDYTAMIWTFLLGYFVFGELPSVFIYVGSTIVVVCGLFVLWREHRIGAKPRVLEGSPSME